MTIIAITITETTRGRAKQNRNHNQERSFIGTAADGYEEGRSGRIQRLERQKQT